MHEKWMVTLNGELLCGKKEKIHIEIAGRKLLTECVKVNELFAGVEIIIGLNTINQLGEVLIRDGMAIFDKLSCAAVVSNVDMNISESNFVARFNRKNWEVDWQWKNDMKPSCGN